ncbi:MAG: hypothetical protein EBS38_01335 [Actinobacteria bacterium]|nr:hypothetical protein [Actinomycetota bacterium]
MAKSSIIDVWFYVNPETEAIDQVICWFPLGMSVREGSDWVISSKEEAQTDEKATTHDVYQLDWDTDPLTIDDDFDFDDPDNEHIAIKMFDNGELTLEKLEEYSDKILSPVKDNPEYADLEVED